MILTANLDSVYKIDDKKVYELSRAGMNEQNRFVVVIETYFHNGRESRGITDSFLCVGRGNGDEKEESTQEDTPFCLPGNLLFLLNFFFFFLFTA